ncbi:hypothetical protein A0U42_01375 [Megasphaera sp. DISK 18]|nr:hypothetical protein A0U42_01375 [Megasphaera sp. DISK 18]
MGIARFVSKGTKKEDSSLSKPQNHKPVKMNPLCDWISISILGADVNKKWDVLRQEIIFFSIGKSTIKKSPAPSCMRDSLQFLQG